MSELPLGQANAYRRAERLEQTDLQVTTMTEKLHVLIFFYLLHGSEHWGQVVQIWPACLIYL